MSDASIGRRAPPPRRRPAWRTAAGIAIVVAAAVLVAFVLSRCAANGAQGGRGGPGGGRGRPAITVGVAKATASDIPITLTALGTVTPEATVNVNARVSGMLVRVDFREGQMVRKGQLLAQIDPRPFQVAVQQAQGQLM
ncbi:MAG TPA: biotin/lipoyl-binding protein, partial [Caulobacteraceae bacterium]|nr:biotin/lipoyl-binding protein [Caulobacteraceae bacterium]